MTTFLTRDASDHDEHREQVVLVDTADVEIGVAGKLHAHREGVLHRAFSVFVFRDDGATLLQRRARAKYHSGGLWSNTCCSHPRPGEVLAVAARRRLHEEMRIACELRRVCSFTYRADLGEGIIEHEIDHVFIGLWDGEPCIDRAEVEEWQWCSSRELAVALRRRPHEFTAWFPLAWAALFDRTPAASRTAGSRSRRKQVSAP